MSVNVTPCPRIFSYSGLMLPDPNVTLSPEEVKAIYAGQYPELATAAINGPDAIGDKLRYEFVRTVDSKG